MDSPTALAILLVFMEAWLSKGKHSANLLPRERGFAPPVGLRITRLGKSNPRLLSIFGAFSLSPRAIAAMKPMSASRTAFCIGSNSVLRIEGEPIDDGPDDDALLYEPLDGLHHVIVVAPETINPANNESVTSSEEIEQTLPLFAFTQAEWQRH